MKAYLAQLNKEIGAPATHTPSTLHQRFLDWYKSLPELTRNRPFVMSEFEKALNTQGKYISPVLLSLGWQRRRKWNSKGQYHRYWVLPFG